MAGSKPGEHRGGRKAGTPNKPRAELAALLNERWPGFNAVVELADIAMHPDTDIETRVKCLQTVAKHTVPTLKATEHTLTGDGGAPAGLVVQFVGVDGEITPWSPQRG